jgi:hypothetical protein
MQVVKPNREKFVEALERRQRQKMSIEQVACELEQHYRSLDVNARNEYVRTTGRMYANYENRWLGQVDNNGRWTDDSALGSNNTYFTIPLLTAHVDTHTTFYTKVRPDYKAIPFVKNNLNRRLAEMCREIASGELNRMLRPEILQHEAQYLALATLSYRHITMDYQPHSPIVMKETEVPVKKLVGQAMCQDCGTEFESEDMANMQCPNEQCMSTTNVGPVGEMQEREEMEVKQVPERLPRPKLRIPNPILIQRDYNAPSFFESRFIIERKKVPRKEAEFYHQIDLSDGQGVANAETNTVHTQQRNSVGSEAENLSTYSFGEYARQQQETVDEVLMWLQPCEYGLFFADGELLAEQFPSGMHLYLSGNKLVRIRPCDMFGEWIRVQHGVRPSADTGMGMVHLADLNDVVNNTISLEYSILRTHGFPIRLFRGKYIKQVPQALQNIIVNTMPDTVGLEQAVHTEAPSNTSGMLGILTQKIQGYMQYIGGTLNPTGLPGDMQEVMGTATGASAIQEMMSDRMGLSVQMRVSADIETMYSILNLLKQDKRNRKVFLESGYDETVVDAFFKSDFRAVFYFEPAKGTDSPMLDSVNAFKVQSFAQLTANLTGLRQFDPATFYDIVDALGKTLNIDTSIGAGRKERNLAENRVTRITELWREQSTLLTDDLEIEPAESGAKLFQAIMYKEKLWLESVLATSIQKPDVSKIDENDPAAIQQAAMHLQQAELMTRKVEAYLYDYKAMSEAYSDWMQSDEGQSADIPIQVAVGLLYAYAKAQEEARAQIEMQEAAQKAMAMMPPDEADPSNPPGALKSDGQTGPGRPREIHPGE